MKHVKGAWLSLTACLIASGATQAQTAGTQSSPFVQRGPVNVAGGNARITNLSLGPGSQILASVFTSDGGGVYYTTSGNASEAWTLIDRAPGSATPEGVVDSFLSGGDVAIVGDGSTLYYSRNGADLRVAQTAGPNSTTVTSLRGSGNGLTKDFDLDFVPFAVDPNDDDVIFASFTRSAQSGPIQRIARRDIDQRNFQTPAPIFGPSGYRISGFFGSPTAVDYSMAPANNVYLAIRSNLYRFDQVQNPNAVVRNVTGRNFPSRSITAIDVDDSDFRDVLVVLPDPAGNGGELFSTLDAGSSWVDVTGNLPSGVLDIARVGNDAAYLAGTSEGLYTTSSLAGTNTVWTQIGSNTIGNLAVAEIDVREDGLVGVASFGGGVFTANFVAGGGTPPVVDPGTPNPPVAQVLEASLVRSTVRRNRRVRANITVVEAGEVALTVRNSNGSVVRRSNPQRRAGSARVSVLADISRGNYTLTIANGGLISEPLPFTVR